MRRKLESRIGEGANRYALTLETAIRGDRRRWYVVVTFGRGHIEQVYYRGQIQW